MYIEFAWVVSDYFMGVIDSCIDIDYNIDILCIKHVTGELDILDRLTWL